MTSKIFLTYHALLKKKLRLKKEVSVIVARNQNKEEICFPTVEMEFNDHSNLVEYIICPANITKKLEEKAYNIAIKTAKSFNSIGLLAVELFITENNEILINEVAQDLIILVTIPLSAV